MPNLKRMFAPCLSVLLLAGCEAGFRGQPEASLDPTRDVLQEAVSAALSPANITGAVLPGATIAQRNSIVFARFAEIDRLYYDYELALSQEAREFSLISSLVAMAAGIGGTLTGSEAASQAFSAVSTAVAGANEAFNKEILIDRTIQALTAQMRAARDSTKTQILAKLSKSIENYPMLAALSDLEVYRQAGTLPGALLGISKLAADAEVAAREDLEEASAKFTVVRVKERAPRVLVPTVIERRRKLRAAIRDATVVSDEKALEIANAPPARNADFDVRLSALSGGVSPIIDAASARFALDAALQSLNTEAELTAWEAAIK